MYRHGVFCIILLLGLSVNAQTTINLSGKVSNKAGNPIAGATVTLVKQKLNATTGADGAYSITGTTTSALPLLMPQNRTIFMGKDFLQFSLPYSSPVKIEIFDLKGNLLEKKLIRNAAAGFYRYNLEGNSHAANLLLIRASIGQDAATFQYLPSYSGKYMVNQSHASARIGENGLAKVAAIDDTLKTTATGFQTT